MDKYGSRRKSTRIARHDERINSQCLPSVCIGSMLRLKVSYVPTSFAPIHSRSFAHDHVRHTLLRRAFAVIYSYGGSFVSLDADLPN